MTTKNKIFIRHFNSALFIGLGFFAPVLQSAPVTLLNDTFESGNPGYYRNGAAASLFTTDDASGIGFGQALQHNPNDNTFRKIVRTFSGFELAAEGDYLDLNFDLRFPSGAPSANSQGFRFGLYNSNGTLPTADGQNLTGNDFGYYSALGTGGTAGKFIFETEANGFLGGGTQNQLAGGGTTTVNDAVAHQIGFRLERVATGLSINLSFDGASILSIIDTTPTTYVFDQVGLGLGSISSSDNNYRIDNVQLTAIPEPSTLLLMAVGFIGVMATFRRAKRHTLR